MATKNTHSKHFEKVKGYYDGGYWPIDWVKNAVVKGWITATEYKEITNEEYSE